MVARKLSLLGCELQDKAISAIIKMMEDNCTKLISFICNGDHSDFDIDRTYVFVDEGDGDVVEKEVVAVYNNGHSIEILYDNDRISSETLTALDENIIITDNKLAEEIYNKGEFISIDETFAPTDSLLQLVWSVEEALEEN